MNKNSFIYLRGCKHAAFTVFCVEADQKSYYDPQFNVKVPYSSGQQVKRSIMGKLNEVLNVEPSPTEFYFDVDKKEHSRRVKSFHHATHIMSTNCWAVG